MFSSCDAGFYGNDIWYARRRIAWRALSYSRGMFDGSRAGAQGRASHSVCIGVDCDCDVNGCVSFFILRWHARADRIGINQKNDTPSAGAAFFRATAGCFKSSSVNKHTRLVSHGMSSFSVATDACSCFNNHACRHSSTQSSGGGVNIFRVRPMRVRIV